MNKQNFDANKLKLQHIQIERVHINSAHSHSDEMLSFTVDTSFNMEVSYETNLIKTILQTSIKPKKEHFQCEALFEIAYIFQMAEAERFIQISTDGILEGINADLLNALLSVSYSTARGIVWQQCQNTIFNNVLLPIISPTQLLTPRV